MDSIDASECAGPGLRSVGSLDGPVMESGLCGVMTLGGEC